MEKLCNLSEACFKENMINLMVIITNGAAWSIEFQTNGGYLDIRKKHEAELLERNRSESSNVAAGIPVVLGYDSVYDLACNSSRRYDFQ